MPDGARIQDDLPGGPVIKGENARWLRFPEEPLVEGPAFPIAEEDNREVVGPKFPPAPPHELPHDPAGDAADAVFGYPDARPV